VANSKIVFGQELKEELVDKGVDASLLDFESLILYGKNNIEILDYSNVFLKYKNMPKISMFFRMLYIKRVIENNDFDIVNIHVSRWYYLVILSTLIKQKLVITFYGSDFYRTNNFIKKIQKFIYKKADKITFTNPLTRQSFLDHYKQFDEKSYVCRFGLKTLDYIDENRDKNREDIKKFLGYNQQKIIVTCGYNSTKAQQHEEIIDNIMKLPSETVKNVQFLFPMTYGDNENKEKIKQRLKKTNLDYIVLEDFLYENDNAFVKLGSDIMVNVLASDSFSGSMQEFLYAKNVVITGSWLPYKLFDEVGVNYYKIKHVNELAHILKRVIDDIDTFKKNLDKNLALIYQLSSWKNNIKNWIAVYEN